MLCCAQPEEGSHGPPAKRRHVEEKAARKKKKKKEEKERKRTRAERPLPAGPVPHSNTLSTHQLWVSDGRPDPNNTLYMWWVMFVLSGVHR